MHRIQNPEWDWRGNLACGVAVAWLSHLRGKKSSRCSLTIFVVQFSSHFHAFWFNWVFQGANSADWLCSCRRSMSQTFLRNTPKQQQDLYFYSRTYCPTALHVGHWLHPRFSSSSFAFPYNASRGTGPMMNIVSALRRRLELVFCPLTNLLSKLEITSLARLSKTSWFDECLVPACRCW